MLAQDQIPSVSETERYGTSPVEVLVIGCVYLEDTLLQRLLRCPRALKKLRYQSPMHDADAGQDQPNIGRALRLVSGTLEVLELSFVAWEGSNACLSELAALERLRALRITPFRSLTNDSTEHDLSVILPRGLEYLDLRRSWDHQVIMAVGRLLAAKRKDPSLLPGLKSIWMDVLDDHIVSEGRTTGVELNPDMAALHPDPIITLEEYTCA